MQIGPHTPIPMAQDLQPSATPRHPKWRKWRSCRWGDLISSQVRCDGAVGAALKTSLPLHDSHFSHLTDRRGGLWANR